MTPKVHRGWIGGDSNSLDCCQFVRCFYTVDGGAFLDGTTPRTTMLVVSHWCACAPPLQELGLLYSICGRWRNGAGTIHK